MCCLNNSPCSYCKTQKYGYVTLLPKPYLPWLPITFWIESNFLLLDTRVLKLCPPHLSQHPGLGFHFRLSKRRSSLLYTAASLCLCFPTLLILFPPSGIPFPSPLCLANSLSTFKKLKHHLFQEGFPKSPSCL